MRSYPWKDVPIKERPAYFVQYYKWHVLGALFGLILVFGVIKTTFFTPRTDMSILWMTERYSMTGEAALRERLNSLPLDVNGDGVSRPSLQYVGFSQDYQELDPSTQMELLTLIASGEFNVFLVNRTARDWLIEKQVAGTWEDFGQAAEAQDGDGIFCVPCVRLPVFSGEDLECMREMYLMIAQPPARADKQELYQNQMTALKSVFLWEEET